MLDFCTYLWFYSSYILNSLLHLPSFYHIALTMNEKNHSTSISKRMDLRPLKIVIVGAGIGGLFASIALRCAGHECVIYESLHFAIETGAAIHLPSNVNGLLRRYGMIPEAHGAVQCEWISERLVNGDMVFENDLRPLSHAFAYPWQLIHRIDLHNALKSIAMSEDGQGKKVEIFLQSRVAKVDVNLTSIELEGGEVVRGDLIIGADGVHVNSIECPISTHKC